MFVCGFRTLCRKSGFAIGPRIDDLRRGGTWIGGLLRHACGNRECIISISLYLLWIYILLPRVFTPCVLIAPSDCVCRRLLIACARQAAGYGREGGAGPQRGAFFFPIPRLSIFRRFWLLVVADDGYFVNLLYSMVLYYQTGRRSISWEVVRDGLVRDR